jgi:hypothetical protein
LTVWGSGAAEFVAPVDQHAHHNQIRVGLDADQVRGTQRRQSHGIRVDGVGLAAVAGREHPHLRRELRRHIQDGLAVMDQPVRDVPADTVTALHCPYPVGEPAPGRQHLGVAGLIGAEFTGPDLVASIVDNFDRGRSFVRVHANDDRHALSPCLNTMMSARRAPLLRAEQTPFQPLLARCSVRRVP